MTRTAFFSDTLRRGIGGVVGVDGPILRYMLDENGKVFVERVEAHKCAEGAPKTPDTDLQGPALTEKKSWREEAVGRLDRMAGLGAEDGTVGGIDRNAHPFWRNRTPDTTD